MSEETVPCPGCRAPMALDQEVCGACRRPRDEGEIERGRESVRAQEEERRRRPQRIARGVFGAFALAALVIFWRAGADAVTALYARVFGAAPEAPPPAAAVPAPEPPPSAPAVAAPAAPPPAAAPVPAPEPAAPVPAPPPVAAARPPRARRTAARARKPERPAVPPPAPAAAPMGMLRVYGVVFDLSTLRPVAGALVRFSPSGAVVSTAADGRYQLDAWLPGPNDAPTIATVSAKGYRRGQLEDGEPSYLSRTPQDRREALAELSPGDLEDVPVRPRDGETLIPLSFALVPESAARGN